MLTQDRPKIQVNSFQLQAAAEYQDGSINFSCNITLDNETYLQDYALAAAVISWDECTYGTLSQLTAADITNIAIAGDTVWYQIQLCRAIPIDIETFHAHRLQIQQHSSSSEVLTPQSKPLPQQVQPNLLETKEAQQPAGYAGVSVSSQLRPASAAATEFEQAYQYGQRNAAERSHPTYTENFHEYAAGYVEGYNTIPNSKKPAQQPKASPQAEWAVVHDPKWDLYQVWIGDRCLREKAISYQEGERIAQKYIAAKQLRLSNRELFVPASAV